jgi:hypothetical protein
MLGAKFPTVGVPLELALLTVHLGCCAARIVWEYACSLDPRFCGNNRLSRLGHLVSHLELVPTSLNLDSFFASPKYRVCTLFRVGVLRFYRLVVQFLPEFTPFANRGCKGRFLSYRRCNMHTSVPILD